MGPLYGILVALHILGIIFWLGSAITFALWSSRARGVANLDVTAFVYRTMARVSSSVTIPGAFVTIITGVGLTLVGNYPWFNPSHPWLMAMQILGLLAFAVGLAVLHPRGLRIAQFAEQGVRRGHQDPEFYALNRSQAAISAATGLAIIAVIILVYLLRADV